MRSVLAAGFAAELAAFARGRVLVAFDFDGTLAPIVAGRARAAMRPRTRALLAAVCERYPCAVISGRGRADVARRLAGVPVRHVVGNHGLEPARDMARFARAVAAVWPRLAARLAHVAGVEIEAKRFSLAVHYRRAPDKRAARRAIHAAIAALPDAMRMVAGKLVVNVIPARAPHKGDALLRLRAEEGADRAIYVGDDVTDEDVFALAARERILPVRVGRARASAATCFVRDQRQVDVLLARLVALRT